MMKIELTYQSFITNEFTSDKRVNALKRAFHFDEHSQLLALALICERYVDRLNFKSKLYFELDLLHTKSFVECRSQSKFRLKEEKQAKHILKSIQQTEIAEVIDIEINVSSENPPLLFNFKDSQEAANLNYNFTSDETLKIIQSLYEKGFITNPLTESNSIPNSMWNEIPNLVRILQEREEYKKVTNGLRIGFFNKQIVNDLNAKIGHGILTTEKIPSALSVMEKVIYDLIVFRLLESISPACIKEITNVELEVSQHIFVLKYCKIVDAGWRSIKGNFSEDVEIIQDFPSIKKGDKLKIKQSNITQKNTKPPDLHTESSLFSAIGIHGNQEQLYDDIEKLLSNNYIIKENKSFIPTEKGLKIIELINRKPLNNKEIILLINQDNYQEISSLTTKLYCPKCKNQQLFINEINVECPKTTCNWKQFRTICGVQLSISEIENLIYKGKTSLIKGFQVKTGKKFNAIIELNEHAESSFVIELKK